MNSNTTHPVPPDGEKWYCVRTRVKSENLAAKRLRMDLRVQVFSPAIRFQRMRKAVPLWTTEALFPGYIFARFERGLFGRAVQASQGVVGLVEFGGQPTVVPDSIVGALQSHFPIDEVVEISTDLQPGEQVEIVDGPFHGLKTIVTRINSPRQRVAVLIEILGQTREIELDRRAVLAPTIPRKQVAELAAA